jgi:ketosteroid isomerase-like protein
MRILRLITTFLVAVGLSACSGPSAGPQFTKDDVGAITNTIRELRTAFNAHDPDKVADFFSASAVVMPPNQSTVRSKDLVKQYYVARFNEGAKELELDPKDITGVGTLAYASGDFRLNLEPKDGGPDRDRGKFVWIFRKANNRWLIEYVIFSSDFPPRAQAEEASAHS